jgi:Cytochrome P460
LDCNLQGSRSKTMKVAILLMISGALLGLSAGAQKAANGGSNGNAPKYTADGRMIFPANYREWVYLTSGVDMSYSPKNEGMGHSMFDNVFVNPEAYREFLKTGTWPDKTIMVLETRVAGSNASINKKGHFQTTALMGREVHVKDASRFEGKWAFFGFDDAEPSQQIPTEASCYSCHQQHAAVDTTFVQFYPTLIDIAKSKGTLSAEYTKEEAGKK